MTRGTVIVGYRHEGCGGEILRVEENGEVFQECALCADTAAMGTRLPVVSDVIAPGHTHSESLPCAGCYRRGWEEGAKADQQPYDSTGETLKHRGEVQRGLTLAIADLQRRALEHDQSKLWQAEKPIFDAWTPRLAALEYGTHAYMQALEAMKPALDHHYAFNDHHPEHFAEGVNDMSLMQLIEMLCDWRAAAQRTPQGDVFLSIEINQRRFGYSDDIKRLLYITAVRLFDPNGYRLEGER